MSKSIMLPITSERLIIRKLDQNDFDSIYNLCQQSKMGDWFPRWAMNEEEARGFLNWQIGKYQSFDVFNDAVGLGIILKDTNEFIGHCGIGKHDELDEVEIFIGVEKRFRNLNYATEAIDALTKWTYNTFDISHLCATILADNLPSQRAVEKCGYKYVKTVLLEYMEEKVPFKYYRYDF